jgi:hypothetical protein
MRPKVSWTDQDVLIITLAGQILAFAASDDPGFRAAVSLHDEWFVAFQQYEHVVREGPAEQLPVYRAKLIRLSRKALDAVNWGTVKNVADLTWLKQQLEGLGKPDDNEEES